MRLNDSLRVAFFLYSFLFYAILPVAFLRLIYKSRNHPDYRKRFAERLGFFQGPGEKQDLLVHAVSFGEMAVATPIVEAYRAKYPEAAITLTATTPTGSARIKKTFQERVFHCYYPFDIPASVNRFLDQVQPKLVVMIETEIWPNFLRACQQREIPVILANARLSARSYKSYARFRFFTKYAISCFKKIAVQTKDHYERFLALGATQAQLVSMGNVKFDIQRKAEDRVKAEIFKKHIDSTRFVWIAASTHPGEEEQILQAHRKLLETGKNALLILAPRHVDRAKRIEKLVQKKCFKTQRRTKISHLNSDTQVYLSDTMGELGLFYGVANVAFIGGSFVPVGGHNLLEPAICGIPVIAGPYLHNVEEMRKLLLDVGGLKIVKNETDLSEFLIQLQDSQVLQNQIGKQAKQVVFDNQGALNKITEIVIQAITI